MVPPFLPFSLLIAFIATNEVLIVPICMKPRPISEATDGNTELAGTYQINVYSFLEIFFTKNSCAGHNDVNLLESIQDFFERLLDRIPFGDVC